VLAVDTCMHKFFESGISPKVFQEGNLRSVYSLQVFFNWVLNLNFTPSYLNVNLAVSCLVKYETIQHVSVLKITTFKILQQWCA
jgi:hypothetical protein